jgi:hypothetical protein
VTGGLAFGNLLVVCLIAVAALGCARRLEIPARVVVPAEPVGPGPALQ